MKQLFILLFLSNTTIFQAQILQKQQLKDPLLKKYAFVPAGRLQCVPEGFNDTIFSFYISKFEISNADYKLFLAETFDTANPQIKEEIFVDTTRWRAESEANILYVYHYFQHPAYDNYPCVNIKHRGAEMYCAWLEKKLNGLYPAYDFKVQLPTKLQWIFAAKGHLKCSPYPWGGPYTMNAKGQFLCNYHYSFDAVIPSKNQMKNNNDNADITAPTDAYLPNRYGIYNTSGNVAEMIDEPNKVMGGDWEDTFGNVTTTSIKNSILPNPHSGFRPIIIVKKK